MKKPFLIPGGIHTDERGQIKFVNDFDMTAIKRFYQITIHQSPITNHQLPVTNHHSIRAWQGHQIETKYFFVNQGSFRVAAVKIDDWESPSRTLVPEVFTLKSSESQLLCIPPGYANGIQAVEEGCILTVFSDLSLEESAADTYRFNADWWDVWT